MRKALQPKKGEKCFKGDLFWTSVKEGLSEHVTCVCQGGDSCRKRLPVCIVGAKHSLMIIVYHLGAVFMRIQFVCVCRAKQRCCVKCIYTALFAHVYHYIKTGISLSSVMETILYPIWNNHDNCGVQIVWRHNIFNSSYILQNFRFLDFSLMQWGQPFKVIIYATPQTKWSECRVYHIAEPSHSWAIWKDQLLAIRLWFGYSQMATSGCGSH